MMDGFFYYKHFLKKQSKMPKQTITTEQIQEWKKEHGGVYELPVGDKTAYLREPKMKDFKRAFAQMQDGGDLAFGEEMLSQLIIGGDEEIKTQDEYFLPARKMMHKFFNFEEAVITPGTKNNTKITIDGHSCEVRIITREDLKTAERQNPSGKPFVTQEKLFDAVCIVQDEAFKDRDNASLRFPLYQAIESLQNKRLASIKKL